MPPPAEARQDFARRVERVVRGVAPGEVVTYGEVATGAGSPCAARAVGNVLARSTGLPWWRVVAASGHLVRGKQDEHARRLVAEGVAVDGGRITALTGRRSAAASQTER